MGSEMCIRDRNGDILTPETVWDIFGARVRAAEIDGQKILIGVNEDDY